MAGRGFTVKKDWDNPREHAMPEGTRVAAEMRIGSVLVRPATVLAPMAGVTDTVFRRFIRHASLFTTDQGSGNRNQGTDVETGVPQVSLLTGVPGDGSSSLGWLRPGIEADVTNQQSGCGLLMTEFT